MQSLRLDRCPKCKGFVTLQKDGYGLYEECLQCGYVHDLLTAAEAEQRRYEEEKREEILDLQSQACDITPLEHNLV